MEAHEWPEERDVAVLSVHLEPESSNITLLSTHITNINIEQILKYVLCTRVLTWVGEAGLGWPHLPSTWAKWHHHRRRIHTEEKAKVVAAVWGTGFIQFIAVLAALHYDDFEEYDELILFFKSCWCNSSYSSNCPCAKQLMRQEF